MLAKLSRILFVNAILISCTQDKAKKSGSTEVLEEALALTVLIECIGENGEPKMGSGFLSDPEGRVVTNYHVISNTSKIRVKLPGRESYVVATISAESEKYDLAILNTKLKGSHLQKADDSKVLVGQKIYAIGNPLGLESTVSEGIVSAVRNDYDLGRIFQITAAISPGSSGGPVIDQEGDVIAVAVASLKAGQNVNFAIPISTLKKLEVSQRTTKNENLQLLELVEEIERNQDEFLLKALSRAVHYESEQITKIKLKNRMYPKILLADGSPFSGWINWSNPPSLTGISQYENGLVHGFVVTWAMNGIDAIVSYRNGVKEGIESAYWNDVKKPFWKYFVKNGKKEGIKKQWYEDGKLAHIENYKAGKLNGTQKYYFYRSGGPQYEKYYENGKLLSVIGWRFDGKKSPTLISGGKGKDFMYDYKDGRLHQIDEYLDGERIKSTSFWTGGKKLRYSIYDNEENWRSTKWHPNGVKSKQLIFKNYKLDWARGWDPQGIEDETHIEGGSGLDVIYNSKTGKKVRIDEYKEGESK